MRLGRWRCCFAAWVAAWAVSLYAASSAIALLHRSPFAHRPYDLRSALRITFEVADRVSPWAKILPGLLMLLGFALIAQSRPSLPLAALAAVATALGATLVTLALLPGDWSRGFGIGLTGARFDPTLLPTYLAAAVLAGLVFAFAHWRCSRPGPTESE